MFFLPSVISVAILPDDPSCCYRICSDSGWGDDDDTPIRNVSFDDYTDMIPAFLTIVMMLTFSIAEGIVFGMLSYVFLKLITGKHKEITPVMYAVSALFMVKFFV